MSAKSYLEEYNRKIESQKKQAQQNSVSVQKPAFRYLAQYDKMKEAEKNSSYTNIGSSLQPRFTPSQTINQVTPTTTSSGLGATQYTTPQALQTTTPYQFSQPKQQKKNIFQQIADTTNNTNRNVFGLYNQLGNKANELNVKGLKAEAELAKGAIKGAANNIIKTGMLAQTLDPKNPQYLNATKSLAEIGYKPTGNVVQDNLTLQALRSQKLNSVLGTNEKTGTAEKIGNAAGNLVVDMGIMAATGGLAGTAGNAVTKATGKQFLGKMAAGATQGAILGATGAGKEGADLNRIAQETGRNALFFGAGSAGNQIAGKALDNLLIKAGLQNSIPAYVGEQVLKGAAFSSAGMTATYPTYSKEEKPTAGQIASQMLTGAIMDTAMSLSQIPSIKARDKAILMDSTTRLKNGVDMINQLEKSTNGTREAYNNLYDNAQYEISETKKELNSKRFLGQQENVNKFNQALDKLSNELYSRKEIINNYFDNMDTADQFTQSYNAYGPKAIPQDTHTPNFTMQGKPYTNVDNGTIYQPGEAAPVRNVNGTRTQQLGTTEGFQRVGKPYTNTDNGTIYQPGESQKALPESSQRQYYAIYDEQVNKIGNKAFNEQLNELNMQPGDTYKCVINGDERLIKAYGLDDGNVAISLRPIDELDKRKYKDVKTIEIAPNKQQNAPQATTSKKQVVPSTPHEALIERLKKMVINKDQLGHITSFIDDDGTRFNIGERVQLSKPISEELHHAKTGLLRDFSEETGLATVEVSGRLYSMSTHGQIIPFSENAPYASQNAPKAAQQQATKQAVISTHKDEKTLQSQISTNEQDYRLTLPKDKIPKKRTNYAVEEMENKNGDTFRTGDKVKTSDGEIYTLDFIERVDYPDGKYEYLPTLINDKPNKKPIVPNMNKITLVEKGQEGYNSNSNAKTIRLDSEHKNYMKTRYNKREFKDQTLINQLSNMDIEEGRAYKVTQSGKEKVIYYEGRNEQGDNIFRPIETLPDFEKKKKMAYAVDLTHEQTLQKVPEVPQKAAKAQHEEVTTPEVKTQQETTQEPEKATESKPAKENRGKKVTIVDDNQQPIKFQYKVVDAKTLVTSHTTGMQVNPNYPQELQPRDRTREGSKQQIQTILAKLNPYKLGESNNFSQGAPIVGSDNIVESGNGRTLALMAGYEQKSPNMEEYKRYLINHAADFGIDADNLPERPVLVRERLTELNRKEFTKQANTNDIQQYSPSELATNDAAAMNDNMVALIDGNSNIDKFNTAENKAFISDFIDTCIADSDRNKYITDNGFLSTLGITRVKNAIFAKVYGDSKTLQMLTENTNVNIKNVINAMVNVAPKVLQVKNYIREGKCYDCDISSQIGRAAELLSQLRSEGKTVKELRQQVGLFQDYTDEDLNMLEMLDANMKSTQKLTYFLKKYYDILEKCGEPNQISFGAKEPPTINTLLVATKEALSREGKAISLWDMEPATGNKNSQRISETKVQAKAAGEEQGYTPAKGGTKLRAGNESNTDIEGTKKASEIFREFGEKLQMDIESNPKRGTLGTHNTRTHLVKIKKANDITTLAHETGHFLDKEFKLTEGIDKFMQHELMQAGIHTSPKNATKEYIQAEGVAEFVRTFITDPEVAEKMFPSFTEHFAKKVDKKTMGIIEELQQDITKFVNLPIEEMTKKTISFAGEKEHHQKPSLSRMAEKAYAMIYDRTHPAIWAAKKMGGKEQAEIMKDTLSAARGYAEKATYCIEKAQTNAYGDIVGDSLETILKPVLGDMETYKNFSNYCVCRRSEDYFSRGLEFPNDRAHCLITVKRLEQKYPIFNKTFDKVETYCDNMLRQFVEIGMITEDTYNEIKAKNLNYIPLFRVMDEAAMSFNKVTSNQPVKKLKGSGRDIIDPLESITQNTYVYKKAVEDYLSIKDFLDIADHSEDIGALVNKQNKRVVPAASISLESFKKELKKALGEVGIDLDQYGELDLDISKTVFAPKTLCGENEIAIRRGDNIEIYKVDPLVYYAFSKSPISNPAFIKMVDMVGKLNKIKRTAIVTTPRYVTWNFTRDSFGNMVNTRTGIHVTDIAKGVMDVVKEDKAYDLYMRSGAAVSFFSADRAFSQAEIKKLQTSAMQAKNVFDLTKKAAIAIKEGSERYGFKPSELAGRIAEFKKELKIEYNNVHGTNLSEDEVIMKCSNDMQGNRRIINKATRYARDITIDFNRSGGLVKDFMVNSYTTFFNTGLQAMDKSVRVYVDKTTRGRALLRTSIIAAVVTSIYAYLRDKNKNYDEIPAYKADFYINIPKGDLETSNAFYSIPLEYNVALLAQAVPRRLYDYFKEGDKEAFDGFWDAFKQGFSLDMSLPDLLQTYIEITSNKKWTGKDLLNYKDKQLGAGGNKYLQYDENTSYVSKKVAETLKDVPVNLGVLQSPKQLDYVINSQFGTMGKIALNSIDQIKGDKEGVPLLSGLAQGFTFETYNGNTSDKFYTAKEKVESDYQAEKNKGVSKDYNVAAARKMLNKYSDRISNQSKIINGDYSEREKELAEEKKKRLMKEALEKLTEYTD